jgi:hypothetical protein
MSWTTGLPQEASVMQIQVFACDGCDTKIDQYPLSQGWFVIGKKQGSKVEEWHACSVECLMQVCVNIAKSTEGDGAGEWAVLWP